MRDIPAITKNLLIINVLMFAADFVFRRLGIDLNDVFGLHFFLSSDFHIFQLLTYMFMHAGVTHLFFNMFALWMFGRIVENVWGPKRFLTYYMVCGAGAGLIQMVAQFISFYAIASEQIPGFGFGDIMAVAHNSQAVLGSWTTVGASGAIYGILLAFGMLFPEERIFIFPLPVPVKAKWFVALYAVLELALGLGMPGDSVAHFAHLGGMLFGFLLIRYWRNHPGGGMYGGYGYGGYGGGRSIFGRMKDSWEKHMRNRSNHSSFGNHNNFGNRSGFDTTNRETDWEYNARKKKSQDEVDRILDKIRKSGYDSLSAEEKKKLFDNSKE